MPPTRCKQARSTIVPLHEAVRSLQVTAAAPVHTGWRGSLARDPGPGTAGRVVGDPSHGLVGGSGVKCILRRQNDLGKTGNRKSYEDGSTSWLPGP